MIALFKIDCYAGDEDVVVVGSSGVTVMVETIGELVLFIAVKLAIFPVPEAAKPIPGVSFVQLKTVPVTAPVNGIAFVATPAQTTSFCGCVTVGVG